MSQEESALTKNSSAFVASHVAVSHVMHDTAKSSAEDPIPTTGDCSSYNRVRAENDRPRETLLRENARCVLAILVLSPDFQTKSSRNLAQICTSEAESGRYPENYEVTS